MGIDRYYGVERAPLAGYADRVIFTEKFAGSADTNLIFDGGSQPAVTNDFGCVFSSGRALASLAA